MKVKVKVWLRAPTCGPNPREIIADDSAWRGVAAEMFEVTDMTGTRCIFPISNIEQIEETPDGGA